MYLYLVRHAEAKPKQQDPARSLSEAGADAVRRVGAFLGRSGVVSVAEIRHSGKRRAQQTAEILAASAGLSVPLRATADLEPLADVAALAAELLGSTTNMMLVGHLPHLNRLASALVAGDPEVEAFDFEAGAVLCLRKSEAENEAGRAEGWAAAWMLVPGLLPS